MIKKEPSANVLLLIIIAFLIFGFQAQGQKQYIFGKMTGKDSVFTGHFWFSTTIDQMGQQIWYKNDPADKKKIKFRADDFYYFEAGELYLESFSVQNPGAVGKSYIMIPRIVNGYLQLFEYKFSGAAPWLSGDHFFIKSGSIRERIKRKTFIDQMTKLVGGDEALMAEIESKKLQYDDLKEIIGRYNKRWTALQSFTL